MKSQIRIVLFALIAPLAACGGDRPDETTGLWFTVPTLGTSAKPPLVEDSPGPLEAKVAPPAIVDAPVVETPIPTTFEDAMELGKALAVKGETSRATRGARGGGQARQEVRRAAHRARAPVHLRRASAASRSSARTRRSSSRPRRARPTTRSGRAELARYSYDNAIVAFRQATELNPDNVFAWNNLGYTYLQLKQYEDAVERAA